MEIPKEIKIGFRTYDVIYPHPFKDTNHCGMADYQRQEIRLGADGDNGCKYKPEYILQALMHEVIHCIENSSELRVFRNVDGSVNESMVDGWAEWLCMVLIDNPDFTRMFLSRLNSQPSKR